MWCRWLKGLFQEDAGQDLVEYALLLAFVALASVALLSNVGSNVNGIWNSLDRSLSDAITALG